MASLGLPIHVTTMYMLYHVLALLEHSIHYAVFCKESFGNNVDCFWNNLAHELYCLNL